MVHLAHTTVAAMVADCGTSDLSASWTSLDALEIETTSLDALEIETTSLDALEIETTSAFFFFCCLDSMIEFGNVGWTRAPSRSRKPLWLAYDSLRLAAA